ncbi:MAG TPA: MFS transporter [Kofleriaceae bacterium]
MARISRALKHRNYRLFFIGQGISLVGTWLTRFATVWMAYKIASRDALEAGVVLGFVAFFGQAPSAVLAPIAGALVDRWDRNRTIVITQIFAALQSAALALFTFTGWMTVWHLMALGAVQALINAFDMPARQSFLGQMVTDKADLPNAIALNSSIVNGARLLGPVFAAALVDLFGEGWCFTIDAVSYVAVIISLLAMDVPKRELRPRTTHVWADMKEGMRYVLDTPTIKAPLFLLAATSILGGAYSTLLPMVAGKTLAGGPHTLGILMASAGCGALVGALYLASRNTTAGLSHVIGYATVLLGLALCALRWAPNVYVAMPLVFACGLGWMVQMASTNTLIQSTTDTSLIARVLSLYAMAFFGGMPVGALLQGSLADAIGPMNTFLCSGIAVLVGAALYRAALGNAAVTSPTAEA